MDCKEFSNLLDAYLDGALPDEAAGRMQKHGEECSPCAQRLALCRDCRRLDEEIEVPDAFSEGWRRMIREESAMEKRPQKKKWQNWVAAAAALVFVVGGTLLTRDSMPVEHQENGALTAKYQATDDGGVYYGSMARGAVANFSMEDTAAVPEAIREDASQREEKIIRNASFTLKTLDFDQNLSQLQDLVKKMGGRVEYLSSVGDAAGGELRTANLTLRIPADQLDAFLTGAQSIARVTSLQQELEDVSDSYYDVQARLETQKKKLERLEALMATAEQVSDLVEIENAVADAQYLIDSYTAQLQGYDSQIAESTVRVTLREIRVEEAQEAGLGQRIWSGLQSSMTAGIDFLKDMTVFLVAIAPWLAVAGAIAGIVLLIVKKSKKHGRDDH